MITEQESAIKQLSLVTANKHENLFFLLQTRAGVAQNSIFVSMSHSLFPPVVATCHDVIALQNAPFISIHIMRSPKIPCLFNKYFQ